MEPLSEVELLMQLVADQQRTNELLTYILVVIMAFIIIDRIKRAVARRKQL